MKTKFIVNPKSAAGKTEREWNAISHLIRQTFGNNADVSFTEGPMQAVQLARESIFAGYECIIAVGGDGTINEVLNGFFENDCLLSENVALGILEIGTGADFIKSLNMPARWEEAIHYLKKATPRKVDVGKATFQSIHDHDFTDRTLGASG